MKAKGITIDQLKNSACGPLNKHLFAEPEKKKPKRAKYNNEKVEWNGELFDSTKEYKRYRELLLLLKAGEIAQLSRQVKYLLIEANDKEKKCEYWADFEYLLTATGNKVIEDVKSEATRKLSTYVMKRKLMKDKYDIEIKEL